MKILVIGGGGREHALVWKLNQSPRVEKIWCAPGNGGIAAEAECVAIEAGDVAAMVAFAEKARLERRGIPTAKMYGTYDSPAAVSGALRYVAWPVVIKADGLCAGKGVFLAPDLDAAKDFVARVMEKNELGPGGKRIVLEEALEGDELSFIILTDGERYAPLVPTRDHKRIFDGNQGPNTGGMGAYSTDELLPSSLRETIISTIVEPTLRGLAADGIHYQGFLYIGLMLTKSGPKVLEFNCRLGDPETQAIVARMDFDLAEVLRSVAAGQLDPSRLRWKGGASACVVLVSGGYPGRFESAKAIEGLTAAEQITGVKLLHAGTKQEGVAIITSGGRVLGVTAAASSLDAALALAYQAASKIHFDGMHYRKDIGAHATRLKAAGD